jgi:hypothetical protein
MLKLIDIDNSYAYFSSCDLINIFCLSKIF